MQPILVTGGAGFISSHTCKALATHGLHPIVFDSLIRATGSELSRAIISACTKESTTASVLRSCSTWTQGACRSPFGLAGYGGSDGNQFVGHRLSALPFQMFSEAPPEIVQVSSRIFRTFHHATATVSDNCC